MQSSLKYLDTKFFRPAEVSMAYGLRQRRLEEPRVELGREGREVDSGRTRRGLLARAAAPSGA